VRDGASLDGNEVGGMSDTIVIAAISTPQPLKFNGTSFVEVRRALIEVTLRKGRATRYKHAARHVREIDSLNSQIKAYGNFETHDQFMERLRKTHPRKMGFWPLLHD